MYVHKSVLEHGVYFQGFLVVGKKLHLSTKKRRALGKKSYINQAEKSFSNNM